MEIYCICMFYLNEQTDCPILIGIHKVYKIYCAKYVYQYLMVYVPPWALNQMSLQHHTKTGSTII